ncbi:MAG TPA: hypothetical protein VHV26_06570 [Rhizomicrobium sp.]|jgi:hypothetical protein|nr:hypothetical protein [Rhizomicrobium sp.]
MSSSQFAHRYSGSHVLPFPSRGHGPGTCRSCGQSSGDCRCGCRQCRKEAKELTYTPEANTTTGRQTTGSLAGAELNSNAAAGKTTTPTAFIGGGCCVHISLEYAPSAATTQSIVGILVKDTEGTILAWEKTNPPGTHYQIKENVVTTKPGATIQLLASNATVRARWCEVFSC